MANLNDIDNVELYLDLDDIENRSIPCTIGSPISVGDALKKYSSSCFSIFQLNLRGCRKNFLIFCPSLIFLCLDS